MLDSIGRFMQKAQKFLHETSELLSPDFLAFG